MYVPLFSSSHSSNTFAKGWNLPLYNMKQIVWIRVSRIQIGKNIQLKRLDVWKESISMSRKPTVASSWLCLSKIFESEIQKRKCISTVWLTYFIFLKIGFILQRITSGIKKIILKTRLTTVATKTSFCTAFFRLRYSNWLPSSLCQFL